MDSLLGSHARKRKRRRGIDRPPIPAQLVLDEHLKSDVGILSEDLFADLFPAFSSVHTHEHHADSEQDVFHVAIAPRMQTSGEPARNSTLWTILAIQRNSDPSSPRQPSQSRLHFSPNSSALQMFAQHLQQSMAHSPRTPVQYTIDIHILDAVAVGLDTVAVAVDDGALSNLQSANQKYRSGQMFDGGSNNTVHGHESMQNQTSPQERWIFVVKEALKHNHVIHVGDSLPLPVSSHPITHARPPPALVQICEPIAQGLITSHTNVVVVSNKRHKSSLKSPSMVQNGVSINRLKVEDAIDDDTSNEQFYSAAEENGFSPAPKKQRSTTETESEEEKSSLSNEDDTDLSDDDSNPMGLSLPMLPSQASGTMSAFTSATPRAFNTFNDGITSPGSVVSGFSMSTVLGGGSKGKLFEARGLISPIRDEILNPKPVDEEDPEVRAFVDTKLLAKLGCFSGDWVRFECAPEEGLNGLGSWGISAFDAGVEDPREARPMKLYALPWQTTRRPRYAINKRGSPRRRRSIHMMDRSIPKVYLSPIVLANLGNPPNLRLSKLSLPNPRRTSRPQVQGQNKAQSQIPPIAKYVMLHKLSSPIAHEKQLDSSIKWAIQDHFMQRQRAVKPGDLIGIPIEVNLGRALNQGNATEDEASQKEVLALSKGSGSKGQNQTRTDVAWFKVSSVRRDDESEESPWGDLGTVNPRVTEIPQGKDEHGKLPEAVNSTWQYYLGVKSLPPSSSGITTRPGQDLARPSTFVSHTRRRLRELISAATSPQAVHLELPPVAILIVSNQRQVGKSTAALEACADVGIHCFPIDSHDMLSEGGPAGGDVKTAGFFEARAERGLYSGIENTALVVKHVDVLSSDRMVASVKEVIGRSRIFVATTANIDKVPEGMRSAFTHEFEMSAPDEKEREGLLRQMIQNLHHPLAPDVDLSSVALKTAALVAGDLCDVVDRAVKARSERLENLVTSWNASLPSESTQKATIRDVQLAGGDAAGCITKEDFNSAVEAARKSFADAIGAPKIPNVSWNDVGGLVNVKDAVMETIQLPLERPELFAKGMKKRSGILFYGPPGTGKTLLAKAIATEFSLNFFSVKGPELLNMYIGESEANVRRVFQRARDARPCVVFFDELDSVAPKRGNQGDSGGVMDRIVSQLLAELDGMSSGENGGSGDSGSADSASGAAGGGVFVIGATNRPDLLDQALLRPGRFDKMLYLGVPDTHEKQLTILEALTRKFTLDPSLSLSTVASHLPYTYTGADLYALCSDAMLKSITRRANAVKEKVDTINAQSRGRIRRKSAEEDDKGAQENSHTPKPSSNSQVNVDHYAANIEDSPRELTIPQFFDHLATPQDIEVVVNEKDFRDAQRDLVPSVSAKELDHYKRVRAVFEGEGAPKGGPIPADKEEDDFIVRTGNLSIGEGLAAVNGVAGKIDPSAKGKGKDRGKGKGKSVVAPNGVGAGDGFGATAYDGEGEELYGSA